MLTDYVIFFRCFTGPGYWGYYKLTKAFDLDHAMRKLDRVAKSCLAKWGPVGEFRIESSVELGDYFNVAKQGLKGRRRK